LIKNKIKIYKPYSSNKNSNNKFLYNVGNSKKSEASPLLRLNKLLKTPKIKFDDFNFLDIGSGYGIALHFVMKNYHFNNYYGLEFDKYLVDISRENLDSLKKKFDIFHADACNFVIKDLKYIIYLYNPFNETILKKFLDNNLNLLKKNKCIIMYQNNFYTEDLKKLSKKETIVENGLSIYYF
jgi:SAM-dependent methyltransferase